MFENISKKYQLIETFCSNWSNIIWGIFVFRFDFKTTFAHTQGVFVSIATYFLFFFDLYSSEWKQETRNKRRHLLSVTKTRKKPGKIINKKRWFFKIHEILAKSTFLSFQKGCSLTIHLSWRWIWIQDLFTNRTHKCMRYLVEFVIKLKTLN